MGVSCINLSRDKYYEYDAPGQSYVEDKNPNPSNYKIGAYCQYGDFLVVWITYPNCTNFEGNKILVYQNITLQDLRDQKLIDPHFSENKQYHSPIARFLPTAEGLEMASNFANMMMRNK
jgi:hypothetical protein